MHDKQSSALAVRRNLVHERQVTHRRMEEREDRKDIAITGTFSVQFHIMSANDPIDLFNLVDINLIG